MRISTKGRYAVRAMLELALRREQGTVQTRDIARTQGISVKYLERLMSTLRGAGLVQSQRETHNGFTLARAPKRITILEIVTALEGPLAPVECLEEKNGCARSGQCATRQVWERLQHAIDDTLRGITLADLARMHAACAPAADAMYCI